MFEMDVVELCFVRESRGKWRPYFPSYALRCEVDKW